MYFQLLNRCKAKGHHLSLSCYQSKHVRLCTDLTPPTPCQHSHPPKCLNFPLYLQFPRGGSYRAIPSLNYISIPATVALVTAAMVTSQSVQVEWPECGP